MSSKQRLTLVLAGLSFALWLGLRERPAEERSEARVSRALESGASFTRTSVSKRSARVERTDRLTQVAPREHETAHPTDGERARLQYELQLVGALNDALDCGDAHHLRTLVELHRRHDPRDLERMQEGYTRLADCLEFKGEAAREAGARFYEQARASTLRRFVRRICLEQGS